MCLLGRLDPQGCKFPVLRLRNKSDAFSPLNREFPLERGLLIPWKTTKLFPISSKWWNMLFILPKKSVLNVPYINFTLSYFLLTLCSCYQGPSGLWPIPFQKDERAVIFPLSSFLECVGGRPIVDWMLIIGARKQQEEEMKDQEEEERIDWPKNALKLLKNKIAFACNFRRNTLSVILPAIKLRAGFHAAPGNDNLL